MEDTLELAKIELKNTDDITDMISNPAVKGIISIINEFPILGQVLASSTEQLLRESQKRKRDKLISIILESKECITSEKVNDVEFFTTINELSFRQIQVMVYFINATKNIRRDGRIGFLNNVM